MGETPGIGHNRDPLDLHGEAIEDLLTEARNWLDAKGVQSQADVDGVAKLLDMLRKEHKAADAARAAEKKPHDDAAKAVQARWKPILERADLAIKVCKQAVTPFLTRQAEEQARAEAEARRQAEAAEIAAQQAMQATGLSDLEGREEAENLAKAAKAAEAEARRAGKQKAHARGGSRAIGLRTSYRAEITDATAFAKFVWQHHRAELHEFLATLAARLVRNGQRGIPGVTVIEEKEAA